ncbi:hypothetical protein SAMN00790413_05900 [Deinococcus hopiensis KR-140]|uniref:Uncharacterized protein n=1 Tax=Deinococcus hopiensis KR-140 TaxID=695939 RepID=A0A1W1UEA6_9DEIO|nr:hypothetical protein SAMN00790413_05900 [Deinococcus hopiensis KR-140]
MNAFWQAVWHPRDRLWAHLLPVCPLAPVPLASPVRKHIPP